MERNETTFKIEQQEYSDLEGDDSVLLRANTKSSHLVTQQMDILQQS